MERETINELSATVVKELERLGYASTTVKTYERWYRKLVRYADEKGIHHYSQDVCEQWLKESLGLDPMRVDWDGGDSYKPKFYYPIRVCQCLTEWHLHGCLALKKQGKLAALKLPQQFKGGYESYATLCRDMEYSEGGYLRQVEPYQAYAALFRSTRIIRVPKYYRREDIGVFPNTDRTGKFDGRHHAELKSSFFPPPFPARINTGGPGGEVAGGQRKAEIQASTGMETRGCSVHSQFDRPR